MSTRDEMVELMRVCKSYIETGKEKDAEYRRAENALLCNGFDPASIGHRDQIPDDWEDWEDPYEGRCPWPMPNENESE
jgi:hypothetical protein